MIKIVTFVGGNNQIYQVLVIEDKPTRTLIDSKLGTMTFTPLENGEGRADDCPPPGERA